MVSGNRGRVTTGRSGRRTARGIFIRFVATALCCLAAASAQAADIYWSNPNGGSFDAGANWTGGVAPGASDAAHFNIGSAAWLNVVISSAITNQSLTVHTDRVSLDLGGQTYSTSGNLTVGSEATSVGYLTLTRGNLSVGGASFIGEGAAGCAGHAVADGTNGLTWTTTGNIRIGSNGTGTLDVTNGAAVTASLIDIGHEGASAQGTLNVSDSGTTLTSTARTYVGNSCPGTLFISSGATVNTNGDYAYVGLNDGGSGTVTVSGEGSAWNVAAVLCAGSGGDAVVDILDGGSIVCSSARMGYGSTSASQVTVSGAGSQWVSNGNCTCGHSGQAALLVEDGGLLQTNTTSSTTYVGDAAGGSGLITVRGSGSHWDGYRLYVGGSGSNAAGQGQISVEAGGLLSMAYLFKVWSTGTVTLAAGTIEMPATKKIESFGVLTGAGTIRRSGASGTMTVENKYVCTPGGEGATGTIVIQNGLYTQTSTGSTTIELNNINDYDRIIAADAAVTVDGNVTAKILPTHVLHTGETYDVIIGNTVTLGANFTFTNIVHPRWSASYAVVTITSGDYSGKQALRLTLTKLGPVVEDLGDVYHSAGIGEVDMWRDKCNAMHLMVFFRRADYKNACQQFIHIEMATGTAYLRSSPTVGRMARTIYDAATHAVYFGSLDYGGYAKYDLTTHTTSLVNADLADKGLQCQCNADDGTIYLGEFAHGVLERYNPVTQAWYSYGLMDDPGPPYYRYVYTVGADTRYAFCAIRDEYQGWYLVVYDTQTSTQTVYWDDSPCKYVGVSKGQGTGAWYITRWPQPNVADYWRMDNGVPVPVDGIPGGPVPPTVCDSPDYFPNRYGYEVDLAYAMPADVNNATSVIRYRQVGAQDWTSVSVSGMTTDGQYVRQLVTKPDGNLFGAIEAYQPAITYSTSTLTTTIHGQLSQASLYDVMRYDDSTYYLSGYGKTLVRYDASSPWTLTPSTPATTWKTPAVNPYDIPAVSDSLYNLYMAKGSNGFVYVAGHREREEFGGAVGWYNPSNAATGLIEASFVYHDSADLIAVNGGAQLCYSTYALSGGDGYGRLYLLQYNSGTQTIDILNSWVPIATQSSAGKIVEVAPGVVFGVVGNQAYRFNLSTGQTEYTVTLPGTHSFGQNVAGTDRRLVLGPDGYIWLFMEDSGAQTTKLYRYNPANGAGELIVDNIGNKRGRTFVFVGDDIYMYGASKSNMERIQDLLP